MEMALSPGDKAPDFHATAIGGAYGDGKEVALGDFAGRTVVL
jgi:peroxiredoxin